MTKSIALGLAAHTETLDDTSAPITWPQASSLLADPGDYIVKNRGTSTSYTSAEGVALVFGASFDGSVFTGSAVGSTTVNTYDGPYACVAPGVIDFLQEAFHDVEIFGDIGYSPDIGTGEYPVTLRSGDLIIHSQHVANNAITPNHLHPAHSVTGHFAGGVLAIDGSSSANPHNGLFFVAPNTGDTIFFMTDDGSGDSINNLGGQDGGYALTQADHFGPTINGAYESRSPSMIGSNQPGDVLTNAFWPSSGPALSMLSFCHFFPGSSGPATISSTGGSLGSTLTYAFRYCYYKSLTLKRSVNGAASTYTQVIETPLSTPLLARPSSGSTNTITFTVPATPAGWDGIRIYANEGSRYEDVSLNVLVTVAGAMATYGSASVSRSGNTYTFAQVAHATDNSAVPTLGFAAWPPGTQLIKDPNAVSSFLMKLAHVDTALQQLDKKFPISTFNGALSQSGGSATSLSSVYSGHIRSISDVLGSLAPKGVPLVSYGDSSAQWDKVSVPNGLHSKQADGSTNAPSGNVPVADGSGGVSWGAGGGGSSAMTNPMTTTGDLISTASGGSPAPPTRIAASTAGFVLTSNGSGQLPSWQAAAFINPMTGIGDLIYGAGSGFTASPPARLAAASGVLMCQGSSSIPFWSAGSFGQVLTSNGSFSAPSWQSPSFANPMNTPGDLISCNSFGSPSSPIRIAAANAGWPLVSNGFSQVPTYNQLSNTGISGISFGSVINANVPLTADGGGGTKWSHGSAGSMMAVNYFGNTVWSHILDAGDLSTIFSGGSFATNTVYRVNFNLTFPHPPVVTITPGGDWGSGTLVYANSIDTAGFSLNIAHATAATVNHCYWTAILPLADGFGNALWT